MNVYILIIKDGELNEVVDSAWLNRKNAEDYMNKWGGLRIEEIKVADVSPNHEFKSDACFMHSYNHLAMIGMFTSPKIFQRSQMFR